MSLSALAQSTLEMETRSLLTRLDRVEPFSLSMPGVAAAALSQRAVMAIERSLVARCQQLRGLIADYRGWLRSAVATTATAAEAQRRFAFLKLKFNAVLTQFDIFADVLTQRSEHRTGVWLGGLDVVAADALELRGPFFNAPPVVTYLDRGHGAAIRRARTRLPGGAENPVAIVRVPRERMVGSGVASSLVHEAGHQGAALLDLVDSMRSTLQRSAKDAPPATRPAWLLWDRWISEVLADFWSVAKVGVAATQGLMNVVSLPRAFVFRIATDDPHPFPWIRVMLSAAMGEALYPDPQWRQLADLWVSYYPLDELDAEEQSTVVTLQATIPAFVRHIAGHRPRALRGHALASVFPLAARQPARLRELLAKWWRSRRAIDGVSPTLVLAMFGQAKQDGRVSPEDESRWTADLLTRWALRRAVFGDAGGHTRVGRTARVADLRPRIAA